jgi:hypothetical protein
MDGGKVLENQHVTPCCPDTVLRRTNDITAREIETIQMGDGLFCIIWALVYLDMSFDVNRVEVVKLTMYAVPFVPNF